MGIYRERVLPRLTDRAMGVPAVRPVRERACAGLEGVLLEIGFGSGRNVGYYPSSVTRVLAVEPSDLAWEIAAPRLRARGLEAVRVGLDAASLPVADGTVDCVLSTLTLCTVPDVEEALREVRRVLRPGGRLHFAEHGLAPDGQVRRWQRLLGPAQRAFAGGCHLDRDVSRLVAGSGLRVERLASGYLPQQPRPWSYVYEGVAVRVS